MDRVYDAEEVQRTQAPSLEPHTRSAWLLRRVLFDRAVAWLLANKVVLPGLTILERAVARVRSRANERLWQRLTDGVTAEQRQRLEGLLVVPEGKRDSTFDRLLVKSSVPIVELNLVMRSC